MERSPHYETQSPLASLQLAHPANTCTAGECGAWLVFLEDKETQGEDDTTILGLGVCSCVALRLPETC